jgi:hypothetical protein
MFPHRNIHKFISTPPDGKTHNQIGHILIDRRQQSSVLDTRSSMGADCDISRHLVVSKIKDRLAVSERAGRAVAQRLDAGFPRRRPGFVYGQHVGFVVDKAALGQIFFKYFGFPCLSFHRFLHYHNHPWLTQ